MKKTGKPSVKSRRGRAACPPSPGRLVVHRVAAGRPHPAPPVGRLHIGGLVLPCAIGAGGLRHAKREGDRATPIGCMRLVEGFFRADRLARPGAGLPLRALKPTDGWCDDPHAPAYNRPVRLPHPAGHETLWRADGLYDVVLVLDYNLRPCRRGRGSAIFLHCAKPDLAPTLGCVALRPADLRRLLPRLRRGMEVVVA